MPRSLLKSLCCSCMNRSSSIHINPTDTKSHSGWTNLSRILIILFVLGNFGILVTLLIWQIYPAPLPNNNKIPLQCKVLIIGSGFAGSYAAYQLAPQYKEALCLVERLNRDGGRVYDVSEYPGGPVFGVGALRITELQKTMKHLADELGITMQVASDDVEVLKVRGRQFIRDVSDEFYETTRMCQELFPTMNCDAGIHNATDKMMWAQLLALKQHSPQAIYDHPDFPTLIISLFGDEGLAFIRECTRYNSPLTSVSSQGILDFFTNELRGMGLDPLRSYPEGGVSQYIKRMLSNATGHGMRIFRGEPVLEISTVADENFKIVTRTYSINAEKVLCSIDPLGFKDVAGNVAERVKSSREFQALLPKTLAIVTAWWNERWWENSGIYSQSLRNLSRVVSHDNCFNTMDIPTFPYGRDQNVTRAVYDDGACVDLWRMLVQDKSKKDVLENTVIHSLQQFFGNVTVPRPRYLDGFVHENAWHFQHPRSTVTNEQVFEWSVHPVPYDNFALIGEAYNLNFAAWCDGALKSTMTVLTKYYNFTYPCLDDLGSPAKCDRNVQKSVSRRVQFDINNAFP